MDKNLVDRIFNLLRQNNHGTEEIYIGINESDSTEYEIDSNKLDIGVYANNVCVGMLLLKFLRVLTDDRSDYIENCLKMKLMRLNYKFENWDSVDDMTLNKLLLSLTEDYTCFPLKDDNDIIHHPFLDVSNKVKDISLLTCDELHEYIVNKFCNPIDMVNARLKLYEYVSKNIHPYDLERVSIDENAYGFKTHQEFLVLQKEIIDSLTDEDIDFAYDIFHDCCNFVGMVDKENMTIWPIDGFFYVYRTTKDNQKVPRIVFFHES